MTRLRFCPFGQYFTKPGNYLKYCQLEAAGLEGGVWPQTGVEDLTTVMKTWTQQAGLPLVTVSRVSDSLLEVSQSHYQNNITAGSDRSWAIPLTWLDLNSAQQDWDQTLPDLWLVDTAAQVRSSCSPAWR